MNQDTRDLAHAGLYLLSLALLLLGGYYGGAYAISHQAEPVRIAAISAISPDTPEPTRLSVNVATAREVRAALAKPIPGPPKLEPITAKVAFGHYRPGGKDYMTAAVQQPKPKAKAKRRSIPREALDAMAMQPAPVHAGFGFSQQTYVRPDKHRVVY